MLHLILSHWKRIYFDSIEDDSIKLLTSKENKRLHKLSQERKKGEERK